MARKANTVRTFDTDGRLVKVTDAAARSRTFAYDARGNLISDQLGHTTSYAYTPDFNRLAKLVDANAK